MISKIPREKDLFSDISFSVGYDFQNQQNNRHKNKLSAKETEALEANKINMSKRVRFKLN